MTQQHQDGQVPRKQINTQKLSLEMGCATQSVRATCAFLRDQADYTNVHFKLKKKPEIE